MAVYTQYNNAPTLNDLINHFYSINSLEPDVLVYYNKVYNLLTAEGRGLEFWGIVLNQGRTVSSISLLGWFGFGTPNLGINNTAPVNFNNGVFGTYESQSGQVELGDDDYRELLLFRYNSYIINYSIFSLSSVINNYTQRKDPTYYCLVKNESVGLISYNFNYTLSDEEMGMFIIDRVLPVPAGYEYILKWDQVI